ncbi:uncharacterized protein ACLA_065880 [Aspergillus clavatus NRRL 1]|uniref:Uncharacterized protein n=1 Tax=Aspergillus clavatus (strain ATCC 1007 / CBS 513.65 / DSM 816 / NCTC 3887 / NRRL 1 / QM 1276 / 107) TaxID=344612 RepID=A1CG74_ASPCL|nr:uncharacterized protein ACLA_065880 [Aspergillus clavatus NRRL 1]EAW10954.1 conserved hypothetical protein [Aspergillus clavatus NRRL 1]
MPLSTPAKGRKKDPIHFVNARPTSETERLRIQRLVRAHVGKWISDQTKDRSAATTTEFLEEGRASASSSASANRVNLSEIAPHYNAIDAVEFPLPSSSSPSVGSSRESPESTSSRSLSLSVRSSSHVGVVPMSSVSYTWDQEESDETTHEYGSDALVTQSTAQQGIDSSGSLFNGVIGADVLDPFHTYPSRHTPRAIDACRRYMFEVLWPNLTPPTPGGPGVSAVGSWFPLSMTDPTLFAAFLFGTLSHQRCQWINGRIPDGAFRPEDQRLLQESEYETIKLINDALNDPNRALSDAIVLSVMCMGHNIADDNDRRRSGTTPFNPPLTRLQWLDVYASLPPNLVHLQGLVELVRMRGGLKNIRLPGAGPIMSFSAILTASYLLSAPIFPYMPLYELRQSLTLQELLGYTPLDVELGFGRLCQIGFTAEMADVFQALRVYTNIVIEHMKHSQPNPDLSLLCDQRNLVQQHLLTLPPAQNIPTCFAHPHHKPIYEACRLAALTYSVGVTFPLPSQSTPLARLGRLIQEVLHTPDAASIWSHPHAQLALLWVLTLGGIAATNQPERDWFVRTLGQAAAHAQVYAWSDLKRVLEFMLWYDVACDQAGYTLWAEVEQTFVRHV